MSDLDLEPVCTCAHTREQHFGECMVCTCTHFKRAARAPKACRYPLRTPVTSPRSFYDAALVWGGIDSESRRLLGDLTNDETNQGDRS